jgi:hypothetical protein
LYSLLCPDELIEGCIDENGTNYNPEANVDDGSCIIYGCPFANACNYDPLATEDDGSCFVASDLNQQGADIDGEAANDQSGWSVSLSSDGTTVAIGAPLVTTATALTPVTFVFTHGIALQVLGNSKALTSTAKRRMIRAASQRFSFLRRHDRCYWGEF